MSKLRYAVAVLTVTVAGLAGTKLYEGKSNTAYVERIAGGHNVTVCYGHTATAKLGQTYTDAQCDELLLRDLTQVYAPIVKKHVKVPLSVNEFNALVDFTYNVGGYNFATSTLLVKLNAGDYESIPAEIMRWVYVKRKDCRIPDNRCSGIIKRRQWEAKLFAS